MWILLKQNIPEINIFVSMFLEVLYQTFGPFSITWWGGKSFSQKIKRWPQWEGVENIYFSSRKKPLFKEMFPSQSPENDSDLLFRCILPCLLPQLAEINLLFLVNVFPPRENKLYLDLLIQILPRTLWVYEIFNKRK